MADTQSQTIEKKLRLAWRQEQRFVHVRGASRLAIWLVVLILLDFLIDWGIVFRSRLGLNAGVVLLVLNVIVLGWVLWREWLRHLRPFDPVLVSLDVEAKHPELASLLVSYSQLRDEAPGQQNVSRELIEAMREQAVIQTKPIDFREIIDFGQLKRLLIATICIVLFFGAASINWSGHLGVLFQRLVGSPQEYPTQTTLESVTGDFTVKAGEPATVIASVSGVVPENGRLYVKPANGDTDWTDSPLVRSGANPTFNRELSSVNEDLLYYVRIGDDQSETFRISVVAAPEIVSVAITLKYPDYMKKSDGKTDQLNLAGIPEGTEIHWTLRTSEPVDSLNVNIVGQVKSHNGGEGAKPPGAKLAKKSQGDTQLTFSHKATGDFKYAFQWARSVKGQQFEYDDVQHVVRVDADAIPDIELARPDSDGLATDRKTVTIKANAFDDHGLSKAWLVYSINGSEEKRVEIFDFAGVQSEEFSHVWQLKKSIPELEEGMRIAYAIEVVDFYPESIQHVNRSATRQLTIVNKKKYLEWYLEQWAARKEEIRRARNTEAGAKDNVKQIKEQESPSE